MDVKVYMRPSCPFSRRAMQLLRDKGVQFEALDVSRDPLLFDEREKRSGRDTVPELFIHGQHVGGCDELVALERSGELDRLLGAGRDAPAGA
jgi:glutaredoxin 3